MNIFQLLIIAFLHASFFCTLLPMEENTHIGPIDQLMFLLAINTKGADYLKTKIENQHMGLEYGNHHMPFIITHYVDNNNNPNLANILFSTINSNALVKSENPANLRWNQQSKNLIPIDHCSCAKKINDNTIMVMTIFHDKPSLKALFSTLINKQ